MSALLEPTGLPRTSAELSGPEGPGSLLRMPLTTEPSRPAPTYASGRGFRSLDLTVEAARTLPLPDGARRFSLAGVDFVDVDLETAADHLAAYARAGHGLAVHLCNAYTVTLADRSAGYRGLLNHRSLNLPDGTPVSWYHRVASGLKVRGPVRGPSLMRAVLERPGLRHYLLGSSPEVLADLERAVKTEHPDAVVAGVL